MKSHRMAGLLLLLAALGGCGHKEPPTSAVRGRVFYRGNPLAGGAISFVPDAERGHSGALASGTIQDDGTFSLKAEQSSPSSSSPVATISPGWYRVAIAPRPSARGSAPSAADPYPGPPNRYRNPQRSGIAGEVKAGIDNVFEFHLDDAEQ